MMSTRAEDHDEDRPRPVRFSIFGGIQQQQQPRRDFTVADHHHNHHLHHHLSIKAESEHSEYSLEEDRFRDDIDDDDDQPLDFSSKKSNEPQITASVGPTNGSTNARFNGQPWALLPVSGPSGNTSESGVSDLCSNSPQSENGDVTAPPPPQQPQQAQPAAALNAIYGPLAALQAGRASIPAGIDPAITAATTQLLSNLAAVTNGGKGGKNTRPFKAYPRDPMSLPLGLYGLPITGNVGEETAMTQASNDAYTEFRRQMLSQVNATKGHSMNASHNGDSNDMAPLPETTIRGTVSVTDLRLSVSASNGAGGGSVSGVAGVTGVQSGNEEDGDSEHSANVKSPPHIRTGSSPMVSATTSGGRVRTESSASYGTDHFVSLGSSNGSGKKRGRNGDEIKDEAYWERRRKNNEAAKRSRDARRAKEDEIAIRAAFLEQENLKLRFELANLKNETAKLRCMIYNS